MIDTHTIATRRNMRKAAEEHPRAKVFALDLLTGEEFSATDGDYFMRGDDEPLTNADGDPLVLAVKWTTFRDALTGEEL